MTTTFSDTISKERNADQISDEEMLNNMNRELLRSMTMEHKARFDSVMTFISVLAQRLKLAFILPQILENAEQLKEYLNEPKHEKVIETIRAFLKARSKKQGDKYSPDKDVHILIDCVLQNYDIVQYLPDWLYDLNQNENKILKYLDDLKVIAIHHFATSAKCQIKREEKLDVTYRLIEKIEADLTYLKRKIKDRRIMRMWRKATKSVIAMKMQENQRLYERDVALENQLHLQAIQEEYMPSTKAHNTLMKQLEKKYEKVEQDFNKCRADNMNTEKSAMHEKNKLLLQLQALIKKYDDVMLQKYRESMELDEKLLTLKRELNELQPVYEREKAIHYELVVKDREAKEELRQLLILQFTQNRAAKIIQRWYQKILRARKKPNAIKTQAKAASGKRRKNRVTK